MTNPSVSPSPELTDEQLAAHAQDLHQKAAQARDAAQRLGRPLDIAWGSPMSATMNPAVNAAAHRRFLDVLRIERDALLVDRELAQRHLDRALIPGAADETRVEELRLAMEAAKKALDVAKGELYRARNRVQLAKDVRANCQARVSEVAANIVQVQRDIERQQERITAAECAVRSRDAQARATQAEAR